MPQKILQPHALHELADKFRAVLFGKLRPQVGIADDDEVRMITQPEIAEVNKHLRIRPRIDPGVDDFHGPAGTDLLL